jgi:hypothetical protein
MRGRAVLQRRGLPVRDRHEGVRIRLHPDGDLLRDQRLPRRRSLSRGRLLVRIRRVLVQRGMHGERGHELLRQLRLRQRRHVQRGHLHVRVRLQGLQRRLRPLYGLLLGFRLHGRRDMPEQHVRVPHGREALQRSLHPLCELLHERGLRRAAVSVGDVRLRRGYEAVQRALHLEHRLLHQRGLLRRSGVPGWNVRVSLRHDELQRHLRHRQLLHECQLLRRRDLPE